MVFTDPRTEHRAFTVTANAHAQRALGYLLPIVNGLRQRDNARPLSLEEFAQECFETGLWTQYHEVQQREDLIFRAVFEHGTPELRDQARVLLLRLVEQLPPDKRVALPEYRIERR